MYARCAAFIQDKRSLCVSGGGGGEDDDGDEEMGGNTFEDKLAGLVEIIGDEDVANAVVAAARTSMGMDCSAVDMVNIVNFTQRMVKLAEYRKQLASYLTDKMTVVAPNLSTLIGDTVAARLISKVRCLNISTMLLLAMYKDSRLTKHTLFYISQLGWIIDKSCQSPSLNCTDPWCRKGSLPSTQTKGNTPKYGLIYHSTFIGRADAKNKGRISRYLANKCSIATTYRFVCR